MEKMTQTTTDKEKLTSKAVMRTWKFYGFRKDKWQIGWWFIGWDVLSLGINIGLPKNLEIHLPFGFFIIGHTDYYQSVRAKRFR